jgi:hypothetical protein
LRSLGQAGLALAQSHACGCCSVCLPCGLRGGSGGIGVHSGLKCATALKGGIAPFAFTRAVAVRTPKAAHWTVGALREVRLYAVRPTVGAAPQNDPFVCSEAVVGKAGTRALMRSTHDASRVLPRPSARHCRRGMRGAFAQSVQASGRAKARCGPRDQNCAKKVRAAAVQNTRSFV